MTSEFVSVLLFARYKDLLGASSIAVPRSEAATVQSMVRYLRSLPGGAELPEAPFVAVNQQQASPDLPIGPTDEIALLPPMAGG